jgi:hypothetical protein
MPASRSRAHHQAFERRHPHAGLDAAAVFDRGDARAAAEVAGDDAQVLRILLQPGGGAGGDIAVTHAVKSKAPDAEPRADVFRQRIFTRAPGQRGVECGVEDRDVRDVCEQSACSADRANGGRIVQRRQALER